MALCTFNVTNFTALLILMLTYLDSELRLYCQTFKQILNYSQKICDWSNILDEKDPAGLQDGAGAPGGAQSSLNQVVHPRDPI